jgi:anti-sigma B factor antagonist
MEIKHAERGAAFVVSIIGSLDASTSPQLAHLFDEELANGRSNIVADLGSLDYTSSAGLRVLLNATKQARQRGGDLRLASVQEGVHKVLELSGFTSILRFYPDVNAAAESYKS